MTNASYLFQEFVPCVGNKSWTHQIIDRLPFKKKRLIFTFIAKYMLSCKVDNSVPYLFVHNWKTTAIVVTPVSNCTNVYCERIFWLY